MSMVQDIIDQQDREIERLRAERDEAVALLREESYEQYRFTQMTEYPSVTRMLLWHMDRRRRIDDFLAADSATHRENANER